MPPDPPRQTSHLRRSTRAFGPRLTNVTLLGEHMVDSPMDLQKNTTQHATAIRSHRIWLIPTWRAISRVHTPSPI
jgi:hypothetical protein